MPATETDAAAGRPFGRFPRVQLLFCIACLAMAAWMWIRYSYRWEMTPEELAAVTARPRNGYREDIFVRVTGIPRRLPPSHIFSEGALAMVDSRDPSIRVLVFPDGMTTGRLETYGWDGAGCVGRVLVRIAYSDGGPVLTPSGQPTPAPIVGRV